MAKYWQLFSDRQQIASFIEEEKALIQLKRRPKVQTAAGGYTRGAEVTLAPQAFRLVPFKRRITHGTTTGSGAGEGRVASLPYVLVGAWDADIEPGDYFDWANLHYEVLSLEPNREVRTAAELIEKGTA